MKIVEALLIVSFVVLPLIILLFAKRHKKNPTEGRKVYFKILDDLHFEVKHDITKTKLMKEYNLTSYEASLLISMTRAGEDGYVESFINKKLKDAKSTTKVDGDKDQTKHVQSNALHLSGSNSGS